MDNKIVINNEFDYSNCLPTAECVSYLVKYMYEVYENLLNMMNQDEEKNKQFKREYKEWSYKKTYGDRFEVYIRERTYNNIICKDYSTFISAIEDGNLKNVIGLSIRLDLDFRRGKGEDLTDFENSYSVIFEPFSIIFARKSNNKDSNMNQIENNIKLILDKFPTCNTIFCTK